MADNDPDDGWQVVKSKNRKPGTATSDQVAANKSAESSTKASASSTTDLQSPVSAASTSKRRAANSKAKRKGRKSKSEATVASELLPTSESTSSTKEISTTSSETILQPSIGIPDPEQTFAVASRVHVSPTRSQSSSDSASYVTAEQLQAPETLSSSSESYDSADEGSVPLDPSLNIPRPSIWTPTTQHGSSAIPGASLWENPSSNPELSPTAPKPSLWQPPKNEDTLTTPRTSLRTGTQDSEPKRHELGQVQVSVDESGQEDIAVIEEKDTGSRTTNPSTNKASTSNRQGKKSIQTTSEKHEISKLEEVPPQSSSGNIISQSSAGPVDKEENKGVEGAADVVINNDVESSGNTPRNAKGQKNPELSSTTTTTTPSVAKIHEESSPSSSTILDPAIVSAPSTSVDPQTALRSSSVTPQRESVPSSSTNLDPASVSAPSASVDPQIALNTSSLTSHDESEPLLSSHHDPGRVSAPSTSADPQVASNTSSLTSHEEPNPLFSTHNDPGRVSGSTTSSKLKISSTPSTATTIHEQTGPSSSSSFTNRAIPAVPASSHSQSSTPSTTMTSQGSASPSSSHQELEHIPSSSTPTQHELPLTTAPLVSIQEETATVSENPASIVSATTSNMSSDSDNTKSDPTSVQPEEGDDETTPKQRFAQLAIVPEQGPTAPIRPPPPSLPVIREEGSEFAGFRTATIPAEDPSPPIIETLTREQAAAVRPRLNANEQALTGFDIVGASSSSGPSRAGAPISRAAQSPRPRGSVPPRRSHAIPIRAPLPAPGFARPARPPPVVQAYDHGIRGVPSHYIPMQGAMHGMFFDPVTNMFVGDGAPRATPERPDGSLPGTTRAQAAAEPVPNRPVNPEDALHVQTEAHIASINAASARAAAAPPVRRPVGVAPTSAPTRAFQRYFCRCTGQWLDQPHDCPEPPPTRLPSAMPILPGTVLGPEWMTHRLVVDESIYPGGVAPAPGSTAATMTSAVGGGIGDLPARWFAPAPAGTAVGPEPTAVAGGAGSASGAGSESGAGAASPAEGSAGGGAKKGKGKRSGRRKNKGGAGAGAKDEKPGPGPGNDGGEGGGSGAGVAAA